MQRRRTPRRIVAACLLPVLAATTLAACSTSSASTRAISEDPRAQAVAAQSWPLTGEPVPAGRAAARAHPVLVAKIDNTSSARPQRGLASADMVAEQLVEGGQTRLAAFFYSELPATVGPLRSVRTTDVTLAAPLGATLVASGGAALTQDELAAAGVETVFESDGHLIRDGSRPAPYNVFGDLAALAQDAPVRTPDAVRPPDLLAWGGAAEPTSDKQSGDPASRATIRIGSHTSRWVLEGDGYRNVDELAAAGEGFRPDTLLVLQVKTVDAGYRDPAGNPVPETVLTGRGDALVLHQGRVRTLTWERSGERDQLSLRDADGTEVTVPAGRVYLALVPTDAGEVTLGR